MRGHPGYRSGHLSGRASHPGTLEEDDLAAPGQRVGDGRVPVVQGPGEVLQKDEWWGGSPSESTVRVRLETGLDELRRCADGARVPHGDPGLRHVLLLGLPLP